MSKHEATLDAIFTEPTLSNIPWKDIESLFANHGATITKSGGSRVRVEINGELGCFHSPHPRKEACKGAVESVREFLENAGIKP